MASLRRRVYTVRAGRPFLLALAEALLSGAVFGTRKAPPDPLELADVTLMLPSRGLVGALQGAFLKAAGGTALLLPRIKPIADNASDLDVLTSAGDLAAAAATGSPRAIGPLEQQLVLTALVFRWARQRGKSVTPARAAHLAKELAVLMDLLEVHGLAAPALADLVPEDMSEHWKETLEFLHIVTELWPNYLAGAGALSPTAHKNRILRAEIARLETDPPFAPVIMAGITGLDPVAMELARAVLALPNGALVLPALDQECDDATWDAIVPRHPEHPQFALAKLLAGLDLTRADVQPLPGPSAAAHERARARFANEAMRPAETTEHWHTFAAKARGGDMARALEGLSLVEAASAEEEAEAIALMLREAAETPGRTAALITPDRTLARRVSVRLRAWDMKVPVSTGTPFTQTPSGTFLDLVINAVAHGFTPRHVADLLKHPMLRASLPPREVTAGTRALELAVFRQPYFGEGLDDIARALERAEADKASRKRRHPALEGLAASDWEAARALVDGLKAAFRPLEEIFQSDSEQPLASLVRAHTNAALELTPREGLWFGPAGEWGATFFARLLDPDLVALDVAPADYPDFYRTLVAAKSLRIDGPQHPRLWIWDPYEARLQQPDLVILGGLNESTWPAGAEPGPWLNRPMRATLRLPSPEEDIGDAAHDFTTLLSAPRVVLTRAAKVDGAPTVPSRWLLRLEALRKGLGDKPQPAPWIAWAAARNAVARTSEPISAPAPRPPLALRPRKLSVTAVEKWFANPYALYAQRILRLEPLAQLDLGPNAALRGEIIHDALGKFARAYPERLPDDVAAALIGFANEALQALTGSPRVAAFWTPRFARFATWFAETEPDRRQAGAYQHAEISGQTIIDAKGGPFTLTARADRIDARVVAGKLALAITDYKLGADIARLAKRAATSHAPQLPLEAAIALAGGFDGLGSPQSPPVVETLRYISASGGEPPGAAETLANVDIGALATSIRCGLTALVSHFDDAATPYKAARRASFTYDYDDYAHLARVAEWSSEQPEEA